MAKLPKITPPAVAVITGASQGIGKALAIGMAEDGFDVALLARNKEKLLSVADQIRKINPNSKVLVLECDVGDETSVQKCISEVYSSLGTVSILINNAGAVAQGSLVEDSSVFEKLLKTNLLGAFLVSREIVKQMKEQRSGYIINISSVCGKVGFSGTGMYSASKFGLLGLNDSLFHELIPFGIRVTALCPSWVDTDMAEHCPFPAEDRIQTSDILKTVRFLLSLDQGATVKELVIECPSDPL
jgi:NAD(P)-dependent dehydrogenase (short-subunit alcohol dehydrogenase family)